MITDGDSTSPEFGTIDYFVLGAMKKTIKSIFTGQVSWFFLTLFWLGGVTNSATGQEYGRKHLGLENGLPSNKVYRVTQTSDGFYWILTDRGLVKYNGEDMTIFDTEDGLPNDDVFYVYEDEIGRLWVFTLSTELCYIRGDSVTVIDTGGEIATTYYGESAEGLLFRSQGTSVVVDYEEEVHIQKGSYHWSWIFDASKSYFDNGIELDKSKIEVVENDTSFTLDLQQDSLGLANFFGERLLFNWNMAFDRNQRIHVTKDYSNLVFFDRGSRKISYIKLPHGASSYSSLLITKDHQGYFQVFVEGVIYRLEEDLSLTQIADFSDHVPSKPNSVYFDQNGTTWVSTDQGVDIILEHMWDFSLSFPSESVPVTSVSSGESVLTFATDEKIFRMIDNDIVQDFPDTRFDGLYDVVNTKDEIFFTARGLPLKRWEHYDSTSKVVDLTLGTNCQNTELASRLTYKPKYFTMLDDAYVASVGRYIVKCDRSFMNCCLQPTKGVAYDLENIKIDSCIWLTTDKGLFRLTYSSLEVEPLQGSNDPIAIFPMDSIVLLSNRDKSVTYWHPNTNFAEVPHVKISIVNALQYEEEIFLISDHAVYIMDKHALKVQLRYDFADTDAGLQINDVDIYRDSFYFATNRGLLSASVKDLPKHNNTGDLALVSHSESRAYEYDYSDNAVTFRYQTIDLNNHDLISFQYKLIPSQGDYNSTKSEELIFTDLDPGTYRFQVRTVDEIGNVGKRHEVRFKIKTPWFKTYWFYGLLAVVCVVGLLLGIGYYVKRQNKKAAQAQRLAELELSALQSQMNPHFIFNALNSIQNLIGAKDTERADIYVARFAFLMRRFLEASKRKFISLADELEITRAYLDLEKLRFADRLDFAIEINVGEDVLEREIPATLIQPFAENAIIHGIFHKKGKGHITINVEDSDEDVIVTIIDNGIGMSAAAKINASRQLGHISRGTELINEKLKVVERMNDYSIQIATTDLATGTKSGTMVEIVIKNLKS